MSSLFSSLVDIFHNVGMVFSAVFSVWFIIFPPLLYFLFKILWMLHVQGHYASKITWVLLEIIPPREVEKSPQLMESIYAGFAGVIKGYTTNEIYIVGMFPVAFSLEMASIEGKVHLYIRTHSAYRNLVEAHFYSQYPDIELVEAEDYTTLVPKTIPNKDWDLWGCDFQFMKDDLYPIRTYKYFEESVTGKMIDPLSGLIEVMGKLGPGQHLWFQMITAPVDEKWYATGALTVDEFLGKVKEHKPGVLAALWGDIVDVLANLGKGLMGREVTFSAAAIEEKKDEAPLEFRLSPGEKDVLKAMQANLAKQQYKVRMRFIYMGRRETFAKPVVSAFIGGIKQFNDQNMNAFKPVSNSKTEALYLFVEPRLRYRQRRIFRRYVTRDSDPSSTTFLLSSEELATVFHVPDMAVVAPTMTRVAAKRGSAPPNLPLQDLVE